MKMCECKNVKSPIETSIMYGVRGKLKAECRKQKAG